MNKVAMLALAVALGGCSAGDYSGAPDSPAAPGSNPTQTGGAKNCDELFAQSVQPRLDFCRNCHVPGGVADVPDGKLFQLATTRADDLSNLRASWERLGRNDAGKSRILLMASGTDSRSHSGGTPWPVGGPAYVAMDALLLGFVDPSACATSAGPVAAEAPLLGSKRAQHAWASYCQDKPDDAALPADPRTLVQPGANAGKAVYYNAWWENCHVNAPAGEQQAKTCGEYRARRDRGRDFLLNVLPAGATSADNYNATWQKWGLPGRPDDFDQLYTLRYGLNHAPFRNPYPLPGEDPNATDGGSGQLPLGMRQLKDADGKWTGNIGSAACFQCHGGQIGDVTAGDAEQITLSTLGLGNNNYDVPMAAADGSPFAGSPASTLLPGASVDSLFNIGIRQRGQNNAVGAFELLITLLDLDSLGLNPDPLKSLGYGGIQGVTDTPHPIAHTQDTPAWWNMGSRPRKFFDAGVSNDSTRIIMAAGPGETSTLVTRDGKAYRDRIEQYDQDLEAFFLSLRSPQFPGAIDTALAEQGAILFHSKNLWDEKLHNPVPKPLGGNGSCASCHGAYSPRYVNDAAYLDSPVLEGVAAHIVPLATIGTDRARSDMLTPTLRKGWVSTFWGYPEGMPGYVAPDQKNPLVELADDTSPLRGTGACAWEQDVIGYQAPPLYGVWATAPYLHNGSVPTVAAVLDSSLRVPIWQRALQTIGPVTGFDQRLSAYDFDALGWRSVALSCAQLPGDSLANCNPAQEEGPSLFQIVQNVVDTGGWTGLVSLPDPGSGAIDKRLVYDTRILGNGNGGHTFTDVLTPAERRAIIEYLKTL